MRNVLLDYFTADQLDRAWRLRNAYDIFDDGRAMIRFEPQHMPDIHTAMRGRDGRNLPASEVEGRFKSILSLGLFLKDGPVIVQADPDLSAMMASTEIRCKLGDYRQKSHVIAVELPVRCSKDGDPTPALALLRHSVPGQVVVTIVYKDPATQRQRMTVFSIGEGPSFADKQIEDILREHSAMPDVSTKLWVPGIEDYSRIALNLALLMTVRPYDVSPLPPKVAKNRRGNNDRLAMLAAREVQTVKFRDLIAKPRPQYIECENTGRKLPPHMRLGHWKMQACGEGWKDRKLIWIEPYWTGAEEARNKDVTQPTVIYR